MAYMELSPTQTKSYKPNYHPQASLNMNPNLYHSAQCGDLETLKRFSKEDFEYQKTANGNNILHLLAQASDSDLCVNAVKHVLNMNIIPKLTLVRNGDKEIPLVIASRRGHFKVVEALNIGDHKSELVPVKPPSPLQTLRSIVNEDHLDANVNDMKAAIREAVRFNMYRVVELFVDQAPELFQESVTKPFASTFLYKVLSQNPLYSAKIKSRLADDVDAETESPLYIAVVKGHNQIVALMLTLTNSIAYHGPEGRTALHAAAMRNSKECVAMILKNKKDLTKKVDICGWTALHRAVEFRHTDIIKLLLDEDKSMGYIAAGKDSSNSKTALHIAVMNGHLDVIQQILAYCPDCWDMTTKQMQNILHLAIENEHQHVLEWILRQSWSSELINKKDEAGNTPLHIFVDTEILEGYKLVHHPGVDRNAFNKIGLTPLDMITQKKSKTFRRMLVKEELCNAGATSGLWKIIPVPDETPLTDKDGYQKGDDHDSSISTTYMTVATLIVTVAFAAGFTIPGGYDSTKENLGMAVFGRKAAFITFVVFDSLAMLSGMIAVLMQLLVNEKGMYQMFPLIPSSRVFIAGAMTHLVIAFISGLYLVVPVQGLRVYLIVVCAFFCLPIYLYSLYVSMETLPRVLPSRDGFCSINV